MALQVTHATQAAGTDSGNGEIHKAQWNEAHSLSMATNKLLGRSTAGTGSVEELTIGAQLSLSGGTLNVGTGIPVASSTMNTNKILGRTTAASGAVEELSIGTGLSLSAGSLSIGTGIPITAVNMNTNKLLGRSTASTGVVEELTIGNNLSLSSGTLNVGTSVIQNLDLVKVSRSGGSIIDITDYNNVSVSGLLAYTWAQFTDASFNLTIARHVIVTDKHSSISGYGGSLWYIDPTAPVGSKQQCRSGAIVTSWGTRPAASSFVGLEIILSDFATKPKYRSDGTNYLPVGRQCLFHGVFGTQAAPTCSVTMAATAQTFAWPGGLQPTILANMGIANSKFMIDAHLYRNSNASTYTPVLTIFLGKNGTPSDLGMYGVPVTSANTSSAYVKNQITLRSQSSLITSYTGTWGGFSFAASTSVERSGSLSQLDFSFDQKVSANISAVAGAGDIVSIQTIQLWHEI